MNYLESLLKHNVKVFSNEKEKQNEAGYSERIKLDPDMLAADLFCHITYLSALATSDLPRSQLFEYATRLSLTSSLYLRKVHFMAKKLSYDYSEACRIVGEKTKETEPKALLLRMAGAMASGESEAVFLERESNVMGEVYGDEYERGVESLKQWTDAFIALIISASLVVVICVVSMLIFPMQPSFIAGISFLMCISTMLGVWVMYRSAPKEIVTHKLPETSKAQVLSRQLLFYFTFPTVIVSLPALMLMKADLGWYLITGALVLLPAGIFIFLDDVRIKKNDTDISGFLRSLGGITKVIGTTVNEGLTRLDFGSLASLKKPVTKLNNALRFGIMPDLCWQKLVLESGSEHVNRCVRIFWDGIAVGGDPQKVGNQSSMFAIKISLLRGKRKMVSSGFSYLCLAMHATLAVLLVGIYNIMLSFSTAMQRMPGMGTDGMGAISSLPTFAFFADSSGQLKTLHLITVAMLLMLTFINPAAIKVVEGGHNYKYFTYLSIAMLISGLALVFIPGVIGGMFSSLEIAH